MYPTFVELYDALSSIPRCEVGGVPFPHRQIMFCIIYVVCVCMCAHIGVYNVEDESRVLREGEGRNIGGREGGRK